MYCDGSTLTFKNYSFRSCHGIFVGFQPNSVPPETVFPRRRNLHPLSNSRGGRWACQNENPGTESWNCRILEKNDEYTVASFAFVVPVNSCFSPIELRFRHGSELVQFINNAPAA
jgi:hypothetical protein